ncbi:hypothetical protein [Patulibacter defluvii]|uniref:hypothetical protein n=1 Tax=Patulibacter defluvii TaxID=3095358 RepID=UPI002A7605F8|nr:hypothetical protein [Patulibacter sp. DM4]
MPSAPLAAPRPRSSGPSAAERRAIAVAVVATLLLLLGLAARRAEAAGSGVLDPRLTGLLVDLLPVAVAAVAIGLLATLLAHRRA